MREALTIVRERARRHAEALDARRWPTTAQLAARWQVSAQTVRAIPRDLLPYKAFGKPGATRHERRYHPDDVARYEAARDDAGRPGARPEARPEGTTEGDAS
jgi:hypothetical protein